MHGDVWWCVYEVCVIIRVCVYEVCIWGLCMGVYVHAWMCVYGCVCVCMGVCVCVAMPVPWCSSEPCLYHGVHHTCLYHGVYEGVCVRCVWGVCVCVCVCMCVFVCVAMLVPWCSSEPCLHHSHACTVESSTMY